MKKTLIMKKLLTFMCSVFLQVFILGGCAGVSHGIKVYPQKIYLFVDKDKGLLKILSLPDIKNGYEIKPWSFLSKHDVNIKIEDAQLKEFESKQDSTSALALLQKIVEVGGELAKEAVKAGAAGKAVADVDIASNFGLETGVYELNETGLLVKLSPSSK
jgi:hypothetical protein